MGKQVTEMLKGTLEGNTVTGTIQRTGKPPAKFTLQFVE